MCLTVKLSTAASSGSRVYCTLLCGDVVVEGGVACV